MLASGVSSECIDTVYPNKTFVVSTSTGLDLHQLTPSQEVLPDLVDFFRRHIQNVVLVPDWFMYYDKATLE